MSDVYEYVVGPRVLCGSGRGGVWTWTLPGLGRGTREEACRCDRSSYAVGMNLYCYVCKVGVQVGVDEVEVDGTMWKRQSLYGGTQASTRILRSGPRNNNRKRRGLNADAVWETFSVY